MKKNHVIFFEGQTTGARQKRCDRPLLLRVSASFASSEAMFFVLYGPLVSLVTHTVMFTHVSLTVTFIMVYTRNGHDVGVY